MRNLPVILFSLLPLLAQPSRAQWAPQISGTQQNLAALHFINDTMGFAVGSQGTILKTTNSGDNWSAISSGVTANLLSIHFAGDSVGYVAGAHAILKTTDQGTTWASQSYPAPTQLIAPELKSVHFTSRDTGYVGGYQQSWLVSGDRWSILYKTTNGGSTWTQFDFGVERRGPYASSLFFTGTGVGYAGGGVCTSYRTTFSCNTKLRKTLDGGTFWSTTDSMPPSVGQVQGDYQDIQFVSQDQGYAVGYYNSQGFISRTTNGGTQWNHHFSRARLSGVYFSTADIGWAVGDSGTILKTTDGGVTWGFQNASTGAGLRDVWFTSVSTGYAVGDGGTILKAVDGGGIVTSLASRSPAARRFTASMTVPYSLANTARVQVKVFDVRGTMISNLLDRTMPAGNHVLDVSTAKIPAGIHFLDIKAGARHETIRLLVR